MKGLTKRQREIVDYIQDFIDNHNFSPSYREIMKHFGFSSLGSVYKHISVLKRKGVISAEKNSARSMALAETSQQNVNTVDLPFLGQIAAGCPIETFPQAGTMSVPAALVGDSSKSYVLQVKGDSMRDAHISNGDLIVIETTEPRPGDTIVALIDGSSATLKKYYPKQDKVELHPANPNFQVIEVEPSRLQIQGRLKGLIRSYS